MSASGIERRSLARFLPLVAPISIAVGLWFLHDELARFHYADLVRYLRHFPTWKLLLALTLSAAGYLTLTPYDVLAFRYLQRDLPYRRVAPAGG